MRRRFPIDLVAFAAIAAGILVTHLPVIRHGMCFNDPSWYFHFGHRTLGGDVPYRDYVFQVGPLPIYVDAGFQGIFGSRYVASLFAGLFIKILRVFVVWLIVRRTASVRAAACLAVFCAFDPLFAFVHHWSTSYAELFLTLSGLFLWLASRPEPTTEHRGDSRRTLIYLATAGFSAALVMSARQSAGVMIALVLFVASAAMLVRKEHFTPGRLVALWAGYTMGILLLVAALAALGALGPAIQQMFLDAPAKKGLRGYEAVLDAISGGALLAPSPWRGFLAVIGLPLVFSAAAIFLMARGDRTVSTRVLAVLAVPVAVAAGMFMRFASLDYATDLPRTFLTIASVIAVLAPERMRRWFGLEPIVTIGFGALPLASDWALEMSFPGRGWSDVWALVTGGLLLALASSRLVARTKLAICGAFAIAGIVHAAVMLGAGFDPFGKLQTVDGMLAENSYSPRIHRKHHPMLRGLRVPEWRGKILEWLAVQVPAGSTCFIYANLPALYSLLDCNNPTKLDTTIADFPSAGDAEAAAAALRAHPPDFLLAYDNMWMSPGIGVDLEGKVERYASWNPHASMAIHLGLRAIIGQYEEVGLVEDTVPVYGKRSLAVWDVLGAIRLYRRSAQP